MNAVQQGSRDPINFVLLDADTFEPLAIDANTSSLDLFDPAGGTLRTGEAITVGSPTHKAVYTPGADWDQSIRAGYLARFTLKPTAQATALVRDVRFSVVRRLFVSQVDDAYLTGVQPEVAAEWTGTFEKWRRSAWKSITDAVEAAVQAYPGNIHDPERFELCHAYWTLRDFYRANQSSGGGDDAERAKEYDSAGLSELRSALSSIAVDVNEDGTYNKATEANRFKAVTWTR